MKFINKKDFAKAALNKDVECFVVHISSLSLWSMIIYPSREAQIASLPIEDVIILTEYADFADSFSKKLAKVLL